MKNKFSMKKKDVWILTILFILSVLMVAYYIFTFSKGQMNSDTAAKVLFANQQHEKHQYFPDGFCYSTGVFVFGLENIISLFLMFIKDWMLCREVAQFVQSLLLFVAIFFFFSVMFGKKKGVIGGFIMVILFLLPISDVVYKLYYYEAAYTKNVIYLLLLFSTAGKIFYENGKKRRWKWLLIFTVITVLNNFGIRNIMLVEVPVILGIIVCAFDTKNKRFRITFNEKMLIGISCAASVVGIFIYHLIERYVGWRNQINTVGFVDLDRMMKQIACLPKIMFEIYGISDSVKMLSLAGIVLPFKFIYMIASVIVIPIVWLILIKKIKNELWKWFVCYGWFSNLFMYYLAIATSAGGETIHLLSIYVNNVLLLAGIIVYMWESNVIRKGVILFFMLYSVGLHIVYSVQNGEEIRKQETLDEELIQYLKKNDLDFGYATYWRAYKFTMLTSGDIQILAFTNKPNIPYYWLTSRDWYEPNYHEGKSFIMIGSDQILDEKYYRIAERVDRIGEYTIFIYEQNISRYPTLVADTLQEGLTCEIGTDQLFTVNKAYKRDDKIILEQNGKQFGPYIELESGTYEICVEGSRLKNVEFSVTSGTEHKEQEILVKKLTDDKAIYEFSLDEYSTDVEFLAINRKEESSVIEQVTISYKKINSDAMVFYPFQLQHTEYAYGNAGMIVLDKDGKQFGPYIDLEKGNYSIKVYGENLDDADIEVTVDSGRKNIELVDIYKEENMVRYQIHLEQNEKDMECLIINVQDEPVKVTRLSIRREDD